MPPRGGSRASSLEPSSRGTSPEKVLTTPRGKKTTSKASTAKVGSSKRATGKKTIKDKGKNLPNVGGATSTSYGNDELEGPKQLTNDAGGDVVGALDDAEAENERFNLSAIIEEGASTQSVEEGETNTAANQLHHDNQVDSTINSRDSTLVREHEFQVRHEAAEKLQAHRIHDANGNRAAEEKRELAKREALKRINARKARDTSSTTNSSGTSLLRARQLTADISTKIIRLLKKFWLIFTLFLATLYAGMMIGAAGNRAYEKDLAYTNSSSNTTSTSYRWYGLDLQHNIGQLVHPIFIHPITYTQSKENAQLLHEMKNVKLEVAHLHHRHDVSAHILYEFQSALPRVLMVERDEFGSLILPTAFWNAVKRRWEQDKTLDSALTLVIGTAQRISNGTLIGDRITQIVNNKAASSDFYDKFIEDNQAKLDAHFVTQANNMVDSGVLLGPEQVTKLMIKESAESRKEIDKKVAELGRKTEDVINQVENFVSDPALHKVISTIARQIASDYYDSAHLNALAGSRIEVALHRSLRRVDFFSPETGAQVNEDLTDTSYVPVNVRAAGLIPRFAAWVSSNNFIQSSPADAALETWDRWGQCWPLSLNAYAQGKGLAMRTGHAVIPDEVLIENVLDAASLTPGTGPRRMELLAKYDDSYVHQELTKSSQQYLGHLDPLPDNLSTNWVRVARFEFDATSSAFAQTFPIDVPLKFLELHDVEVASTEFMLRVEDNWAMSDHSYTCLYRVRMHGETVGASSKSF